MALGRRWLALVEILVISFVFLLPSLGRAIVRV